MVEKGDGGSFRGELGFRGLARVLLLHADEGAPGRLVQQGAVGEIHLIQNLPPLVHGGRAFRRVGFYLREESPHLARDRLNLDGRGALFALHALHGRSSPTTPSPGDDIAFDGDADLADLPEKPKPKRRKSKKKKKADGDATSPKSPKLKRKGSRRKKKAAEDAAAAEARAAEAEARVAEQAAEREAMASRIAELEKSVEDLSAPAPDPPAADEKPVCGCVIA